ncbi:hypothetical protein C4577_00445 [Candidatus Parcubacteria bacterium]|nr:MAG: hypothetical protein C4577_00445 [Candidatus Parcubacteria bacterium]
MNIQKFGWFRNPVFVLCLLIVGIYWQFFFQGKIPIPADTLVGAYYPWLDSNWGFAVGVPVKNPPISDVFSQFFLWKYLAVDMIKSGNWPLWNPYSFSGTPFLATYHSSPFFPFNIFLLLPNYIGWGIYIFGQTFVASLGVYYLTGWYTKSHFARIGAGIIFSLSGLMTTWVEFGTGVWAASMMPWIFNFLLAYLNSFKTRFLTLMSLAFVILFLAGHVQLTLYSSILMIGYLVFLLYYKEVKIGRVFIIISFFLLAVLLAALQFLPAFDLTRDSIRGIEVYSKSFNYGLNPWYESIRLFVPDFFGNPTTYNHWDNISYHEQSSFLGSITLLLVLPLLLKRFWRKEIIWWGMVFSGSLFFAFDHPFTRFIYSQPLPFLTYSSASRIFFVTSFAVAILTAFALDYLESKSDFIRLVRKISYFFLIILGSIIAGMLLIDSMGKEIPLLAIPGEILENINVSVRNSILPFVLIAFLLFVTYLRLSRKIIIVIIICVLFFDLGRYFLKYNPFVSSHLIFPTTPVHKFLQSQEGFFRIGRVDPEVLPPNTWIAYGISSIEGYDPMALKSYASYFNRLNGSSYDSNLSRYVEVSKYPSAYIDALNTKYLLGVKRDQEGRVPGNTFNKQLLRSGYESIYEDQTTVIFFNPSASERAYFIKNLTTVKNKQELINRLNSLSFNPLEEAVIVASQKSEVFDGEGLVWIESYQPDKVLLRSNSPRPQFLILADSYHEGWKLFLNNNRARLYEVNGALRGMFVPAGDNELKLVYWPEAFELGLKVSVLAVLMLVLVNIYALRKRIW